MRSTIGCRVGNGSSGTTDLEFEVELALQIPALRLDLERREYFVIRKDVSRKIWALTPRPFAEHGSRRTGGAR